MTETEGALCSLAAHRAKSGQEKPRTERTAAAEQKAVSDDYDRLIRRLETEGEELYPAELRAEIDAMNEILFQELTGAACGAGFAQSQEEYEKNYRLVFARLDGLEERLGERRFLFGNRLTDSDVRLYVTLARFDTAYYFAFRLNERRIRDYPNLWNYAKELYSIPAFRESTDFDAIKRGYLMSREDNPDQILPEGPDPSVWLEPNNRAERFGPLRTGTAGEEQHAGEGSAWRS